MGIQGLTTFLDFNSQLLTTIHLRDIKVIIDGNNLFHFLHTLYNIKDDLGGDYDCVASATRSFFKALAECNVQSLVVFDGPYDPKQKKINTAVNRAKERIRIAYQLTTGCRVRATPILSQDVFISILSELQIDHVTCEGEADPEIAALAKVFKCPVMTNDSDFFIFNLQAGVILLDYVDIKVKIDKDTTCATEASPKYISVQIYHIHKFQELLKMDMDLFALFGTILGNDRVSFKEFEPFFAGVHLPKVGSDNLFAGQRQTKILGVLLWLESVGTLDKAIQKILQHYRVGKQEHLRKIILDSVNNYKLIGEPKTVQSIADKSLEYTLQMFCGHPFPKWFTADLHEGKLLNFMVNAGVSRKVILHAQPENFSLPSAHCCARFLRTIIYGVVLSHDEKFHDHNNVASCCSATCAPKGSGTKLYVEEIDRDLRNQKRSLVEPITTLGEKSIPSLEQVPHVDIEERLNLLCLAHGVKPDMFSTCPHGLELYMMTMIYWVNHSEPQVDWLQLYAVIICLLKLTALDTHLSGNNSKQHDTSLQHEYCSDNNDTESNKKLIISMMQYQNLRQIVKNQCVQESVHGTKENLDKYLQPVMCKNKAAHSDLNTMHVLAQLQSCILVSQALNQVLGGPLAKIPVFEVYNGTFIFCFYQELRSRKKPEDYIIEVLNRCPVLNTIIQNLADIVRNSVNPDKLVCDIIPGNKRSKKKRTKNPCIQKSITEKNITESREDLEAKMFAKCDIVNRFDGLMLDDSE